MTDWTPSETHPGYREKTIHYGPATIIVRRPTTDTTSAEAQTRRALESVMREYLNRRKPHANTVHPTNNTHNRRPVCG